MDQDRQTASRSRGGPRLAVLYLLAVTAAAFAIPAWRQRARPRQPDARAERRARGHDHLRRV